MSLGCLIKGISRKNTHVPFWSFSQADTHGNKVTNRKSFDVKFDNSQGMQKMAEKWEGPSF